MQLRTMNPDPEWEPGSAKIAVDTLRALGDELSIRVWGGDWCQDCQAVLPGFAAGLEAAGIDPSSVEQYPVEKTDTGEKVGPRMAEFDVEYIPTIVLERNGQEVARFVESAETSAIKDLATQLAATDAST